MFVKEHSFSKYCLCLCIDELELVRFASFPSQHLQRHQTERPFLCQLCGKKFKAEKSLKAHLRTACGGDSAAGGGAGVKSEADPAAAPKEEAPLLKCGVCQRDFKNVRRLRDHMASVHEKLKPFLCSSCPYSGEREYERILSSLQLTVCPLRVRCCIRTVRVRISFQRQTSRVSGSTSDCTREKSRTSA